MRILAMLVKLEPFNALESVLIMINELGVEASALDDNSDGGYFLHRCTQEVLEVILPQLRVVAGNQDNSGHSKMSADSLVQAIVSAFRGSPLTRQMPVYQTVVRCLGKRPVTAASESGAFSSEEGAEKNMQGTNFDLLEIKHDDDDDDDDDCDINRDVEGPNDRAAILAIIVLHLCAAAPSSTVNNMYISEAEDNSCFMCRALMLKSSPVEQISALLFLLRCLALDSNRTHSRPMTV